MCVPGSECAYASEYKHIWGIWWSAENQAVWESYARTKVLPGVIIKNYRSIFRISPGAGSAEKYGKKKRWKQEKNVVHTSKGRKICLYNPPVLTCQLSAGCWQCGNESVLDSPLSRITQTPQSSNQTHNPRHRKPFWSVKPPNGSSIWMLRVCAALPAPCASPLPPSPPALSRLQPQSNPNHTTSQTTRLPFYHHVNFLFTF